MLATSSSYPSAYKSHKSGSIAQNIVFSCRCCWPDNGVSVHMCGSSRPQCKQGRGAIFCSLITGNLLRAVEALRRTSWVNPKWAGFMMCLPAFLPWYKSPCKHTHTGSQSGPNMADPQLALIMALYSSHSFSRRSPSLRPPLSGAY